MASSTEPARWRRLLWFAGLWLASVAVALAAVYGLRMIFALAMAG